MKKIISIVLVFAVVSFGVPLAGAEIYRDLDPMVSPEPQEVLAEDSPVSNVVSTETAVKKEKKSETMKKEKAQKSSKKKSSAKSSKSGSKQSGKKTSSPKSGR